MSRVRYRTSIDRVGWALGSGALACGLGAALVGWAGGADAAGVVVAAFAGFAVGALAIAGLGGPIWLAVRRRGPLAAGLTGAGVAGGLAVAVLTRGFGAGLPVSDGATAAMVWTSALATGAVAAFLGGLVALAMWLMAYRAG